LKGTTKRLVVNISRRENIHRKEKRPKGSEKNRGRGSNNYQLPHNSVKKLLKEQQLERGEKEQNTT
jgi:hypothetical protein